MCPWPIYVSMTNICVHDQYMCPWPIYVRYRVFFLIWSYVKSFSLNIHVLLCSSWVFLFCFVCFLCEDVYTNCSTCNISVGDIEELNFTERKDSLCWTLLSICCNDLSFRPSILYIRLITQYRWTTWHVMCCAFYIFLFIL